MDDFFQPPAMSQKIFKMGFSVATVSAYLLCCSLADAGTPISTQNLLTVWNGTQQDLLDSLKKLDAYGIIREILSDRENSTIYQLVQVEDWQAGPADHPEND